MSQKELAAKVGVGNSLISRVESGERWPSERLWEAIYHLRNIVSAETWRLIGLAQLRTWRAFSKDRKGKRP